MKRAPHGREESNTARDWDPRTQNKTAWCVSRASDVLEMIQQKSVYRSNIGTLTRHSAEDQYWQSLDATR